MTESSYEIRNFAQLVAALEDGVLLAELSEKLHTLVAELQSAHERLGGKQTGSLALSVELTYRDQVFDVKADYKIKPPKAVRGRTILWAMAEQGLSRANPKQFPLPLRQVESPAAAIKTL